MGLTYNKQKGTQVLIESYYVVGNGRIGVNAIRVFVTVSTEIMLFIELKEGAHSSLFCNAFVLDT